MKLNVSWPTTLTAGLLLTVALAACTANPPPPAPAAGATTPSAAASPAAVAPAPPAATAAAIPGGQAPSSSPAKLNLNTSTPDQFKTVPNVGDRMVREFNEYRPWVSVTQFRRELGKYVDAGQVAEYETYVFVPISPNEADAATLQQIPGVDDAKAGALIAARPYANSEAFLTRVAGIAGESAAAAARSYLQ